MTDADRAVRAAEAALGQHRAAVVAAQGKIAGVAVRRGKNAQVFSDQRDAWVRGLRARLAGAEKADRADLVEHLRAAESDKAALDEAEPVLAAADERKAELDEELRVARVRAERARRALAQVEASNANADLVADYRKTREEFLRLRRLRDEANDLADRARALEIVAVEGEIGALKALLDQSQAAVDWYDERSTQEAAKNFRTALFIRDKFKRSDLPDATWALADRHIALNEPLFARHAEHVDELGSKIAGILESPDFLAALERERQSDREALIARAVTLLSTSERGRNYIKSEVIPAMQGSECATPLWYRIFQGGAHWSTTFKLGLLKGVGTVLASFHGGMDTLNDALAVALAIRPDQLGLVEEAVEIRNRTRAWAITREMSDADVRNSGSDAAREFLESKKLGKVAKVIDTVSDTLIVVNAFAAAFNVTQEPDFKNALAAGKSGAELAGVISKLMSESSQAAKLLKLAGDVAPAFDIILGTMGLLDAKKRGDVHGTIGNAMMTAGGTLVVTGLAVPGFGFPLKIAGGILSGAGAGVDFFFGDTADEKWMQDNLSDWFQR